MCDQTTETDAPTVCDTCQAVLTDAEIEDFGDERRACHEARVFNCLGCQSECERTDAHPVRTGLCESCGEDAIETERTEALDAAKEAAQEAFDTILDTDDLAVILKALAVLKKITPK
jgi:hypothetical protein